MNKIILLTIFAVFISLHHTTIIASPQSELQKIVTDICAEIKMCTDRLSKIPVDCEVPFPEADTVIGFSRNEIFDEKTVKRVPNCIYVLTEYEISEIKGKKILLKNADPSILIKCRPALKRLEEKINEKISDMIQAFGSQEE